MASKKAEINLKSKWILIAVVFIVLFAVFYSQYSKQNYSNNQPSRSASSETADWKTYEGKDFSYSYPSKIFTAEKEVCDNATFDSAALLQKNSGGRYLCGLAPYVFNIKKVEKKDVNANDSCFLITKKPVLIDGVYGEEYTAKFIGADRSECTKGMTGLYSNEKKLIYVTKNNQLYLFEWHVLDIEQSVYDQILSTFRFE